MTTFKQFLENQDKMSAINTQQELQGKPQEWIQAVTRLPLLLQKEILDERKKPTQEDIDWVATFQVAPKPVKYNMTDLLKNQNNLSSITRTPSEVVQEINQKWGLQIKPGKVYDPTPDRYKQTALKFTGETAKPSVMVDGEIVFGVGRFISALLRGDKQIMVWDIRTK